MNYMKMIIAGLLSVLLCGCTPSAQNARVAATTLPVWEFSSRLCAGTPITVTRLVTEQVSCLHDYSLNVRQVKAAESAETIVMSGAGLEDFLDDLLVNASVIDTSEGIDLLCGEEHEDEHHHEEGHHHEEDPHIWLSPENAKTMARNICAGLSARYPEYKQTFEDNLDPLLHDLDALRNYGNDTLSKLQCRKLITFHDGFSYFAESFDQIGGSIYLTTIPTFSIVVSDLDQTAAALSELALSDENASLNLQWYCAFDTSADQQAQVAASEKFSDVFRGRTESLRDDESGISSYTVKSAACSRDDFYGAFGGIFYLGIMLGLVFTTSAVLIIYYKQISEGYEDQSRFDTMKKVGMTSRDIRKSINSQMLTVFFLPLAAAGMHLAFAFPMISKLLIMFNLKNTGLLVFTTVASFLIFAVLYVIVYRITSNAYFRIVNGKESE